MSTVVVLLDGADVTDHVIFEDAEFTQQANGQPGTARLRLRDSAHILGPRAGNTLTVDVDDVRVWGGWALRVSPGWFFAADDTSDPDETERLWVLEGVDYNILFSKRFLINKAHPTKMTPLYPANTPDDEIVLDIVARFLELGGDGISTAGVTHVGTPNPDQAGNVGNPGESWGASMTLIAQPTQAVFYIDPLKVLRYVDVETVTAPFALSDTPNHATSFGYRDMEIMLDGTDLTNDMLVWGAGAHSTPDTRFDRVEDDDSIALHGRWQKGEFTTALFTHAGVHQRARSFVYGSPQSKRGGKDDSIQVACTTYRPGLTAGQIASFSSAVFDYADNLPIRRLGIRFPTPTDVEFKVYLSYDIDAPWSDYEFWFPKINFHIPPIVIPDFPVPGLPPPPGADPNCVTDDFNRPDDNDPGYPSSGGIFAWSDRNEDEPSIINSQINNQPDWDVNILGLPNLGLDFSAIITRTEPTSEALDPVAGPNEFDPDLGHWYLAKEQQLRLNFSTDGPNGEVYEVRLHWFEIAAGDLPFFNGYIGVDQVSLNINGTGDYYIGEMFLEVIYSGYPDIPDDFTVSTSARSVVNSEGVQPGTNDVPNPAFGWTDVYATSFPFDVSFTVDSVGVTATVDTITMSAVFVEDLYDLVGHKIPEWPPKAAVAYQIGFFSD